MTIDLASFHRMTVLLRECTLKRLNGLSDELLLRTSEHEPHSILWHIGHITTATDDMLFRGSRASSPLPVYFATAFAPGSSPAEWVETPPVPEVKRHFREQPFRVMQSLQAGHFDAIYRHGQIAPDFAVRSIEEAVVFNMAHEGFHFAAVTNLLVKMNVSI